ncbi:hypothetical protein HDU77_006766 [Chytriomyces hyalinus]|nr:hypothetical protein HDU77_006766 [Chytriomyces hyalinus]
MKVQTTPLLIHVFICLTCASIQEKAQRILQHNPQSLAGSADPVNANLAAGPALKGNAQVKAALIDFLQVSTASLASTGAPATSSTASVPAPLTSATTTASATNPPTNATGENLGSSPTPTASSPSVSTTLLSPLIIGIIVFASVAFIGIITAAVIYYRRRRSTPSKFSKLHPADSSNEPMIPAPKAEGYRGVPYLPLMNPMKMLKAKKVVFQYTAANEDELSLEIGELVDVTEVVDENYARGVVLRSGKEGVFPRICVEKF